MNELTLTNQFVVPSRIGTPIEGGSSEENAFVNISASGNSLYAVDQKMDSLTSKTPFFQHLKVLVVSEDVAKIPYFFTELLDIYIRDAEMRRGIKVIIAEGKAKEILEIHPEDEQLPAMFINMLLDTSFKSTGILKPLAVGQVHELHLKEFSYTIPKVAPKNNRLFYSGGAVYHGHLEKIVGTFSKQEMMGLNLILGDIQGGTIEVDFEGHLITFEIQEIHSHTKLTSKDIDNLTFDVNISVEGNVKEVFGTKELTNERNLTLLEQAITEEVIELSNQSFNKGQKEFKADVYELDQTLFRKHPKLWNKVKSNWDHGKNYFSNVNININAATEIHLTGASIKTDQE